MSLSFTIYYSSAYIEHKKYFTAIVSSHQKPEFKCTYNTHIHTHISKKFMELKAFYILFNNINNIIKFNNSKRCGCDIKPRKRKRKYIQGIKWGVIFKPLGILYLLNKILPTQKEPYMNNKYKEREFNIQENIRWLNGSG